VDAQLALVFQLSRVEKLQLMEELWDSIAKEESQQPLAQWKTDELNRREEAFRKDPSTALSWEQVKASILRRHA
jgi:putative addiction module component (TIGR02574 family)